MKRRKGRIIVSPSGTGITPQGAIVFPGHEWQAAGGGSVGTIQISDVIGLQNALNAKIETSTKGQASGTATLDVNGKLVSTQIPDSLLAGLKWKGTWNASTNTPALTTTPSANGDFYKIGVAGTSSAPTGASVNYVVGDWLISNGTSWQLVPSTLNDATTSTKGVVQLAGDLAGGAAAPLIAKINGVTVPATAPTAIGQFIRSLGTTSMHWAAIGASDLPDANGTAKGAIILTQDLGGTAGSPAVKKINGWAIDNEPVLPNQVLAATDLINKKLTYVTQSGSGGGIAASYMRANGSGAQNITGSNQIVALTAATTAGSDISITSNCFLLKAGRTYRLRGNIGGANFTTSGNSYAYAQWRIGQTAGTGTLIGNAANLESGAYIAQNQRAVPIAEAEYTTISDTWVHLEVTTIGTNLSIGNGAVASAWIEVMAGNAAVTGQVANYIYATSPSGNSQAYANNTDLTFSSSTGNIGITGGTTFQLQAGVTYELSGSIRQIASASAFDYSWYNQTASAAFGNLGSANSNSAMGDVSAEAIITPTVATTVSLRFIGASGSGTAGVRFATIKQIGSSATTAMYGATAGQDGAGGTVPAPTAGKQGAYLKGDASWDNMAWQTYTPAITGSVTNPTLATTKTLLARYRVVGKNLEIAFSYYAVSGTGGAAGSGAYLFSLPAGFTIDTTVAPLASFIGTGNGDYAGYDGSTLGVGVAGSSTGDGPVLVVGASNTTLAIVLPQLSSYPGMLGSWNYTFTAARFHIKFTATIPIV